MGSAARALLVTLAFVLELAVLGSCALAASRWSGPLLLRLLAGTGAVLAMAVLWGLFAAPRARRQLSGSAGVLFQAAWFGVGALAAARALDTTAGLVLVLLHAADALGLAALRRRVGGRGTHRGGASP